MYGALPVFSLFNIKNMQLSYVFEEGAGGPQKDMVSKALNRF
jgi:hypothetical protein